MRWLASMRASSSGVSMVLSGVILDLDSRGITTKDGGRQLRRRFSSEEMSEVMAALGQAVGVDGADAGRSAGDQCVTLGILAHLSVS
jgi:hypothetical protein